MNIRVENIRTYKGAGEFITRGRSPLANPFFLSDVNDDKARAECIDKYHKWFYDKFMNEDKKVLDEIDRLYNIAKNKELVLLCYCAPKPCHGNIIKNHLIMHDRLLENIIFDKG